MSLPRYLKIILLFLIISPSVFGQKIFREGFIIKRTGETFLGLVGFTPDKSVPSACVFKRFDIAVPIEYGPDDIQTFGYKNGKRYESLEFGGKRFFAETVIKGELTLYAKSSRYFIEKAGSAPVELVKGKIKFSEKGTGKEFESYKDLLGYLTSGKITVPAKMDLGKDIKGFVESYNKVSGQSYVTYKGEISEKELTDQAWKSGANRNRFTAVSGLNLYKLKIRQGTNPYLPSPPVEAGLLAGISYERVLSKRNDRFALRTDLLYIRQTFYSYSTKLLYSGNLERHDAFFDFSAVRMPLLFQYSLNGARVIPYFNAGASATYYFGGNYRHIEELENIYNEIIITEDRDLFIRPFEFCMTGGAGLRIRLVNTMTLNIEGRFEYGSGLFKYQDPINNTFAQHSLQPSILIGLTF
ncbi:MAG: hypothetical protein U0X39_11905 [Bacteroidales bacterium]